MGIFFLIAPFPDLCLLVLFYEIKVGYKEVLISRTCVPDDYYHVLRPMKRIDFSGTDLIKKGFVQSDCFKSMLCTKLFIYLNMEQCIKIPLKYHTASFFTPSKICQDKYTTHCNSSYFIHSKHYILVIISAV